VLSTFHPTKKLLVETAMQLLEEKSAPEISADEILSLSGISKGSMYHHFHDLDELLETAQVARFAHWVDVSIKNMTQLIRATKTKNELYEALRIVTENTQSDKRRSSRIERASALSRRNASPRYIELIGKESDRLMDGLEDLARESQEKGFFSKKHNPRAVALMVQAYTLGKIVDDYSHNQVSESDWNALIMDVIRKVFMED
jgi:AcrR family transcriptional regulator